MKHETLYSDDNNETIDAYNTNTVDDSVHDENETATEGKPLVSKKFRSTIEDDETATAVQLDKDVLFSPEEDEPEHNAEKLLRNIDPATAKRQTKNRLQEAMKG